MILQQLGWSYGHFRQMQSMQKAVQLTTFCVKSKEKYQCSLFLKNAIVYPVYVINVMYLWYI